MRHVMALCVGLHVTVGGVPAVASTDLMSGAQDEDLQATIEALQTEVATLTSPTPAATALADSTAATGEDAAVGLSRTNPAKLGEEVLSGDLGITVLEFIRGQEAEDRVLAANETNSPLPDDQEYVLTGSR